MTALTIRVCPSCGEQLIEPQDCMGHFHGSAYSGEDWGGDAIEVRVFREDVVRPLWEAARDSLSWVAAEAENGNLAEREEAALRRALEMAPEEWKR